MKNLLKGINSVLIITFLIVFLFPFIHPVLANVGEVETENNGFRKTEVYDATNGGPKETGNSFFDTIFDFFKNIKESIIDGVDNFGSWMKEGWEEFKDWIGPKWDGFTDWLSDFWDGVKEFFSQEWVQNVLKVIGAIIVVAAIILGGVYLLAAIGITLAIGTIIGAIAFGAIGVILAFASGESSFWGMVAGGLAGGLSFLGGLGVLRLLGALKLIPASGFLRVLALGGLGGSGAVTFTLLHGALHYLFTGDSSLWKQAFTFESLFFNFTLGAVMGPIAARIFGKMGVSRLVSGQGNKFIIFLSRKLGRPVSQIAGRLNRAWAAFKSVSIYGAFNAGLTAVLDSIIQWKETGKVDWKRTSQRAAVVFVTTVIITFGSLSIPKLFSIGCACGDEIATSVSKKGQDSTGKIEDGNSDTTVNKGTDKDILSSNGSFIDSNFEFNYQNYLARKAKENKPPRDRLEWIEARDYWLNDSPLARGNKFNKTVRNRDIYDYHEIHLENGKRLDSYDPIAKEIISRKATDLDMIDERTYREYLKEMNKKYSVGTKIRSNAYPELDGKPLEGKLILEIPATNKNILDIERYKKIAKEYGIELRFMEE